MIGKLLLPALAALLAGCATGYDYRAGNGGDYYYGQPSVQYQNDGFYGPYGGFGYGDPGGWSGMLGYGIGYGGYGGYGPYGYGDPYFYPYGYGYPYVPRHHVIVGQPDPPPTSHPGPRGGHGGSNPPGTLTGVIPSVPSGSPPGPRRHFLVADPGSRPLLSGGATVRLPPPPRLLQDRAPPSSIRFERGPVRENSAPARGARDRDDGPRPHP